MMKKTKTYPTECSDKILGHLPEKDSDSTAHDARDRTRKQVQPAQFRLWKTELLFPPIKDAELENDDRTDCSKRVEAEQKEA